MTEHEHGPGCSHHAADSNGNGKKDTDTAGDATPFTIAFKYAAFGSLVLVLALLLPLPGGMHTKTVLVLIGTIIGICLFPLAYVQKKK